MHQNYVSTNPHDEQFVSTFLEIPYRRILRQVVDYGIHDQDRRNVFGLQARYDLRDRFPLFAFSPSASSSNVARDFVDGFFSGFRDLYHADSAGLMHFLDGLYRQREAHDAMASLRTLDGRGIMIQGVRQVDRRGVARLHFAIYHQWASVMKIPRVLEQYAFIACCLARWLDVLPGFLVHSLGIVSLFDQDVDEARAVLNREVCDSPQLTVSWPQETCVGTAAFLKTLERWPRECSALRDELDVQLDCP